MAGLECKCKNSLSNINVPSENIILVYEKSYVQHVIDTQKKILLINFETLKDEKFEYWYCPKCKRIMKVENVPCGKVVLRFIKNNKKITVENKDDSWKEIYIFSDEEMYNAEEEEMLLVDFINLNGKSHSFFLDSIKNNIYKETNDGKFELIYQEEKNN